MLPRYGYVNTYWQNSSRETMVVLSDELEKPKDTGLLDARGRKLYRLPEPPEPAGFFDSWRRPRGPAR